MSLILVSSLQGSPQYRPSQSLWVALCLFSLGQVSLYEFVSFPFWLVLLMTSRCWRLNYSEALTLYLPKYPLRGLRDWPTLYASRVVFDTQGRGLHDP